MRKLVFIGVGVALLLAASAVLRLHDAPYIAFAEGRRADATDGLRDKASHGDSFAAFLVASNYQRGILGTQDLDLASDWYATAARLGEARSIVPYINLNMKNSQNAEQCRLAIALLNAAGRSGDAVALMALGWYYENGFCTQADLATAARYYMGAAKIDRRLNESVDAIITKLDPAAVQGLRPLQEEFDLDAKVALAQFLAAIPFAPTEATP